MKILNQDQKQVESIDFGIVNVGQTKELEYTLVNDTNAEVEDIKISFGSSEVKITDKPEKMEPNSEAKLIVSWTPSLDVKKGLKTTVTITGWELWH